MGSTDVLLLLICLPPRPSSRPQARFKGDLLPASKKPEHSTSPTKGPPSPITEVETAWEIPKGTVGGMTPKSTWFQAFLSADCNLLEPSRFKGDLLLAPEKPEHSTSPAKRPPSPFTEGETAWEIPKGAGSGHDPQVHVVSGLSLCRLQPPGVLSSLLACRFPEPEALGVQHGVCVCVYVFQSSPPCVCSNLLHHAFPE